MLDHRGRRFKRSLVAALTLGALSSCTSLSGPVQDTADDYHDTLAVSSDRILVDNILRASYEAPLDLSDLSSMTGVLSISGTLGGTFPFPHGSSNPITLAPSITAGSTPTFTVVPLNTNGFATAMIQPIAPQTLVALWNSGYGDKYHKFLFRLFIKYISLEPDLAGSRIGRECVNLPRDSTEPKCSLWFGQLTPHSVTVLEPIGPTVPFDKVASLNLASIEPGDYRVGNAPGGKNVQVYRAYAGQVVLCTPNQDLARPKPLRQIYHALRATERAPAAAPAAQNQPHIETLIAPEPFAAVAGSRGKPKPTGSPAVSQPAANAPTGTGGKAGGGVTQTTVNTVLQQNRISAIFNSEDAACKQDEIVLPTATTEEDFATATADFAHVDNRSTAELFGYLGALVQYERAPSDPQILETARETFLLAPNPPESMFIKVSYRGQVYGVDDRSSMGMRALQILSQLVNEAKVSSDIQATSPALFLPIP